MNAPWHVRVRAGWYSEFRERRGITADFFLTLIWVGDKWQDAGTSETRLGAWLMGIFA
jgi:hypothetical protein